MSRQNNQRAESAKDKLARKLEPEFGICDVCRHRNGSKSIYMWNCNIPELPKINNTDKLCYSWERG